MVSFKSEDESRVLGKDKQFFFAFFFDAMLLYRYPIILMILTTQKRLSIDCALSLLNIQ